MKVQAATRARILELAAQSHLSINALAERSGLAPSTLKYTVKPYARVSNTGIVTIQKLCQELGIPLKEFFNSPLFDDLDFEEEA